MSLQRRFPTTTLVTLGIARMCACAVLVALAACGGGGGGGSSSGGSSTPTTPTNPTTPTTPTDPTTPTTPTDPTTPAASTRDATRLLEQAAFGPTTADVASIMSKGIAAWVDEQLNMPSTVLPAMSYVDPNAGVGCPSGSSALCIRDNYTPFFVQNQVLANAVSAPDQLRQRIALAYAQIFVISGRTIREAYGIRAWQQMLVDNAFSNYRTLLGKVTLSPVMGDYLDMVNNDKPDPVAGISANENYSRELMQLCTIGLEKLKADGTPITDGDGNVVPTYDQSVVSALALAFTGWTFAPRPGIAAQWGAPHNYEADMIAMDAHHDTSAKTLLDGATLPAGQTAQKDLDDALDMLANHPNTGPFFTRQLIRFLVTSNPSPQYVGRVAAVFADNGSGVRGDMKAVIRAILLDPEARGDVKSDTLYGKLREPVLYVAGVARALDATTDGNYLNVQTTAMGQAIYMAPSVFNFYQPDFTLPGTTDVVAPPFALVTTSSIMARLNFLNGLIYSPNGIAADTSVAGSIGTRIDLSRYTGASASTMIGALDSLLTHTTSSSAELTAVNDAVNATPDSDPLARARTAAYLFAGGPRYQISR